MRGTQSRSGRQRKKAFILRRLWQLQRILFCQETLAVSSFSDLATSSHIAVVTAKHNGFSDFCANSCFAVNVTIDSSFSTSSGFLIYLWILVSFAPMLWAQIISECSLILLQLPDLHSSSLCIHLTHSPYIKFLYSRILAAALFFLTSYW